VPGYATEPKDRAAHAATVRLRFEPQDLTVSVPAGVTIAEAAEAAGLTMDKPCGGRGRCGKCLVLLEYDREEEARVVLACQERLAGEDRKSVV